MTQLYDASSQWASRPADERFTSLPEMAAYLRDIQASSRALTVSNRQFRMEPASDNPQGGLELVSASGNRFAPTNWSFGQLCALADTPAGYMRKLPAPMAADCINYGMQKLRDVEDIGLLLYKNGGAPQVRAATGPKYGRVWSAAIIRELINTAGQWTVPVEFGAAAGAAHPTVTKDNTTLYASDRDCWVFLADEQNRIEIPGASRNGQPDSLARGFFVWNSEVGGKTVGCATFLFRYMCGNHIIWNVSEHVRKAVRHTVSAPDRWKEELLPAIKSYMAGSARSVVDGIEQARSRRIQDVDAFLATRFGPRMVDVLKSQHMAEEFRPIETAWDVAQAGTAYARRIQHMDKRVEFEMEVGKVLVAA